MAENKTRPNEGSVADFLEQVEEPRRKEECWTLLGMMERITGELPRMWGDSIIGFGTYHYRYASGREGDWFRVGFSPRKQSLTIYVMGYLDSYSGLLEGLGKFRKGKGCLYVNSLEDIDMSVLESLIRSSVSTADL